MPTHTELLAARLRADQMAGSAWLDAIMPALRSMTAGNVTTDEMIGYLYEVMSPALAIGIATAATLRVLRADQGSQPPAILSTGGAAPAFVAALAADLPAASDAG